MFICAAIISIYQYQIIWCRTMKWILLKKMSGKPPLSKRYLSAKIALRKGYRLVHHLIPHVSEKKFHS